MITKRESIYLHSTVAYCPDCKKTELSRVVADKTGVFMERMCPEKGTHRIKIAADHNWYRQKIYEPQIVKKPKKTNKVEKGCPFDCGLCNSHSNSLHLPVFSITNDCNLNCNICFTFNRTDKKYYKSIADTEKIIQNIIDQSGEVELINLTGGEPTLHPDLFEILKICKRKEIGRVTMNTNGLKIASDIKFAEKLKEAGVQLVLSLDTLDPKKSIQIHGKDITKQKLKTLEILESLNIPTTILPVCIKGVNESDVAGIVEKYFIKEFVHSITIQNMTFTGANGVNFEPHEHITIDEVEKLLTGINGFFQQDFFPLGSYHPLCYSVAYYIVHNHKVVPLTRILDKKILRQLSADSYLLNADENMGNHFRDGIDRFWAETDDSELISVLRQFITELYPAEKKLTPQERREKAEKKIKMIYLHPHMDEDNFDLARVSLCGDLVPDESGRMIPACSYNLLYRQHDPRFWYEEK